MSKRAWSNCVLCIPLILRGSPDKCWLLTCDACVITTWRLGLQAPLVARSNLRCSLPKWLWYCYIPNFFFCLLCSELLSRGSPIGQWLHPNIPTQISLQSRNLDGYFWHPASRGFNPESRTQNPETLPSNKGDPASQKNLLRTLFLLKFRPLQESHIDK